MLQGRYAEAEDLGHAVIATARARGWSKILLRALRDVAVAAGKRGALREAEVYAREATQVARSTGDEAEIGWATKTQADVLRLRGDVAAARRAYEEAVRHFEGSGDRVGLADVLGGLAATHRVEGRWDRVAQRAREAIGLYDAMGSRFGSAAMLNLLGEAMRATGDAPGADDCYRSAEERLSAVGSPDWVVPRANRAQVSIESGDYATARKLLEPAIKAAAANRRRGVEGLMAAILMPCVAADPDEGVWLETLHRAQQCLAETHLTDADVARSLGLAAEMALAADLPHRAIAAFAMALEQWTALGRPDEVKRVEAAAAACMRRLGTG
jgi:tetratricopeptide (TPR) repeat protein